MKVVSALPLAAVVDDLLDAACITHGSLRITEKPVAALLDISMPTLDGYEVCRPLRTMLGPEIR